MTQPVGAGCGDSGSSGGAAEIDVNNELGFTSFSKFPPEVRDNVWKMACFQARNVDVWVKNMGTEVANALGIALRQYGKFYFRSNTAPPSILHACKESRSIGLKHYTLEFSTQFEVAYHHGTINVSMPPRIYINWDCDVVFPFCCPSPYNNPFDAFAEQAIQVKYLAVPIAFAAMYDLVFHCHRPKQMILYLEEAEMGYYLGGIDDRSLAIDFLARKRVLDYTEEDIKACIKSLPHQDTFNMHSWAVEYLMSALLKIGKHPDVVLALLDIAPRLDKKFQSRAVIGKP